MMIHIPIIINYHKLSWAINPGLFGKAARCLQARGSSLKICNWIPARCKAFSNSTRLGWGNPGEIPSENDRKTTGGSKTMIVVVVKQLI